MIIADHLIESTWWGKDKKMDREYLIYEFCRYFHEHDLYPNKITLANTEGYPSVSP